MNIFETVHQLVVEHWVMTMLSYSNICTHTFKHGKLVHLHSSMGQRNGFVKGVLGADHTEVSFITFRLHHSSFFP